MVRKMTRIVRVVGCHCEKRERDKNGIAYIYCLSTNENGNMKKSVWGRTSLSHTWLNWSHCWDIPRCVWEVCWQF